MSIVVNEVIKILVVVGDITDEDSVKYIGATIKTGIQYWAQKLKILTVVDNCLLSFTAEHKPNVCKEELSPYYKFVHNENDITVTVLVSPICYAVNEHIAELLLSRCDRRLVVYAGHSINSQPNWYFKDGVFAIEDLQYVFTDSKILNSLRNANIQPKLTICCCKASGWTLNKDSGCFVEIEAIDPFLSKGSESEGERSPILKGLTKFVETLEDAMSDQVQGIFSQLTPPAREGFLKLRNPCVYVFPAGNGDSAFFSVNGFNLLINGGALARPWFWRLLRHQGRVDCIIATHLGNDSLTGINSFLLRKLQEKQVRLPMDGMSREYKDLHRCLLSPDLGVLFMNAPRNFAITALRNGSESILEDESNGNHTIFQQLNVKPTDAVRHTLRLSKTLGLETRPLTRPSNPEPFTLFTKFGVGKLDLYVISPDDASKELAYIREKWGNSEKINNLTGKTGVNLASGEEGQSLMSDLASACVLLVWLPFSPEEKILRFLFPGNTPQDKIFEGLDKMKDLDILKMPTPTGAMLANAKAATKPAQPTTSKAKTFSSAKLPSTRAAVLSNSSTRATKTSTITKSSQPSAISKAASSKRASATAAAAKSAQATSKGVPPLLSKVQTASNRPAKKTVANATARQTSAASRRQVSATTKVDPASSRAKRDGSKSVKTAADKQAKSSVSKPTTGKTKSDPENAKAITGSRTKLTTEKQSANGKGAAKETSRKLSPKSAPFKTTVSVKPAKNGKVASPTKKLPKTPDRAKNNRSEKSANSKSSSPSTKTATPPPSSSENLAHTLSQLVNEDAQNTDADKKPVLPKRPSPEGQDEKQENAFAEATENKFAEATESKFAGATENKLAEATENKLAEATENKLAEATENKFAEVTENKYAEATKNLEDDSKSGQGEFISSLEAPDDAVMANECESAHSPKYLSLSKPQTKDFESTSLAGDVANHIKDESLPVPAESEVKSCQDFKGSVLNSPEKPISSDEAQDESHDKLDFSSVNKSNDGIDMATTETTPDTVQSRNEETQVAKQTATEPDRNCFSTARTTSITDQEQSSPAVNQVLPDESLLESNSAVASVYNEDPFVADDQKENINPETSPNLEDVPFENQVESSNFSEDDDAAETYSVEDAFAFGEAEGKENMPCAYNVDDKGNVFGIPCESDPQSMVTDTSMSEVPSCDAGTPGDAANVVLREDQEYMEVSQLPNHVETSMSDSSPSTGSTSPTDRIEDKELSNDPAVQDQQSVVVTLINDSHADEVIAEKEEAPLSDPPCSFSTTSTTSRRALLESPISTELDSTYNLPSVVGSISAGISNVEEGNEQGAEHAVGDFYDDNGNRANDIWKSDVSDLTGQYQQSPIIAWSEGKEDRVEQDLKEADFTPLENHCIDDEDAICEKDSTLTSDEGLDLRHEGGNHDNHHVEEDASPIADFDNDHESSAYSKLDFEQGMQLPNKSVLISTPYDQTPRQIDTTFSVEKTLASPQTDEMSDLPSPETERRKTQSDVIDGQSQKSETNWLEETANKSALSFSYGGQPLSYPDESVHSANVADDLLKENSTFGHEYGGPTYTGLDMSSLSSASYPNQSAVDPFVDLEQKEDAEQEAGINTSQNIQGGQVEQELLQTHDNNVCDSLGFSEWKTDLSNPATEFSHDLGQLHADQNVATSGQAQGYEKSCEYNVDDDHKASMIRMSDQLYNLQIENNPSSASSCDHEQESTEPEDDQMRYIDVANDDKSNLTYVVDHDSLKSSGHVQSQQSNQNIAHQDLDDKDAPEGSESGATMENGGLQSLLPASNPFASNLVDIGTGKIDSPVQEKGGIAGHTSLTHEAAYTFGANNPFAADITAQTVSNQEDGPPIRTPDPTMAPGRPVPSRVKSSAESKKQATGSKKSGQTAYYFDLAYIPHHANKNFCGIDFFKRIRSKYYVMSGFDANKDEPSGEVMMALLNGKMSWGKPTGTGKDTSEVTIVPTHNSKALHDWFEGNHNTLTAENIHLVASGSRVFMHDNTFEACKIEFSGV